MGLKLFTVKKRKLQGDEITVWVFLGCCRKKGNGQFSTSVVVGMRRSDIKGYIILR